jgi:hypothetical protein
MLRILDRSIISFGSKKIVVYLVSLVILFTNLTVLLNRCLVVYKDC